MQGRLGHGWCVGIGGDEMTSRRVDDFIGFIVLVILAVVALHLLFVAAW